jgi:uncharacterized protein
MRSTMRGLFTLLVIVGGLWSLPAEAQEVSPESLAASRELMALTQSDRILDQFLVMFTPQVSALIEKANPEKGPLVRKIMEELMLPEMRKQIPEAIDDVAKVYTRHFSLEELNELIAFYKTPIGQKFVDRQSVLMIDLSQAGQEWGQRATLKALRNLAPKLKEQGIEVPI